MWATVSSKGNIPPLRRIERMMGGGHSEIINKLLPCKRGGAVVRSEVRKWRHDVLTELDHHTEVDVLRSPRFG